MRTLMVAAGLAIAAQPAVPNPQSFDPATEVIVSDLQIPSAIAFLPDGRALVAERKAGVVDLLDVEKRTVTRVGNVPQALTGDDAGIHDVVLHPQYQSNGWIYLSYSEGTPERSTLAVDRLRLRSGEFVDRQRIFTADAYSEDRYHYGGRIAFADGFLFLSVGDRHHEQRAQQLATHAGKILRLSDDGRVPPDNPFVATKDARPEIWSYGHRNPQGLAFDPIAGVLWETEHGPLGGDELNVIEKGANYGWPIISYGWQYDGGPIGQGIVQRDGMKQPVWVWTPAVAPSGLLIYRGDQFPQWRGSLLIGSMAQRHLNRIAIENGRVVLEERLFGARKARVRCLAEAPGGILYIGTDAGEIVRVSRRNSS